jgi:hypothetical protein
MRMNAWRVTTVVLGIGLVGVVGVGSVTSQAPAVASSEPPSVSPDVSRLSPEARRLYSAVRNPQPGELKWQQIPWLTDLQEGMRVAGEENRPLLLFVSGDDPLEKC